MVGLPRRDQDSGDWPAGAAVRRKLGEYLIDEWLPAMRHVLKPTTLASYEDYARAYVVPVLGNVRLQEQLTAPRLSAF